MEDAQTIAIHESEDSYKILRFVDIATLSMAVQQLILNGSVYGLHEDPLGNVICVDNDRNRYPAHD